MEYNCNYIDYKETGYFSSIVTNYLEQSPELKNFYENAPSKANILKAIQQKSIDNIDRTLLTTYFKTKYANGASPTQQLNIDKLAYNNCFTITTAHQPNIFTGPLYFIYKILHVIKIANELTIDFGNYHFVPIFYMGSEDADLDELGNITIQEKKLVWNTAQKGAVGRMKIDTDFIRLITEIEGQIAVNKFGSELVNIFKRCYVIGKTIQDATFELLNNLFAAYGLLVLVPDDATLKSAFIPIVEKELLQQFSRDAVEKTNLELSRFYKTQAAGRAINLFYLIDDKRERIEKINDHFVVEKLALTFTETEILRELHKHPERFSANVILRPVFQEKILPNIVFVGGGGELAYWLQLKNVFINAGVSYPMLILRNSFLIYKEQQQQKLHKMQLHITNLFAATDVLFTNLVLLQSTNNLSLESKLAEAKLFYEALQLQATKIDATLTANVKAIAVKAFKHIEVLEKKMLRAEKRKFADEKRQLTNIKETLFPNDNLQERVENFSYLYSKYGMEFFSMLLASSKTFEQQFGLIEVNN